MEQKANKMGVMPVGKLALMMGLPLILLIGCFMMKRAYTRALSELC